MVRIKDKLQMKIDLKQFSAIALVQPSENRKKRDIYVYSSV